MAKLCIMIEDRIASRKIVDINCSLENYHKTPTGIDTPAQILAEQVWEFIGSKLESGVILKNYMRTKHRYS